MKEPILVSACLLGITCRYDGKSKPCERVMALKERYHLIAVCPEVLGGLTIPRQPAERRGDQVINAEGVDVTKAFQKGAEAVSTLALQHGCKTAVLKSKSPSCGKGLIYDGTFSNRLTIGHGLAAKRLIDHGIRVLTEDEIEGV